MVLFIYVRSGVCTCQAHVLIFPDYGRSMLPVPMCVSYSAYAMKIIILKVPRVFSLYIDH